MPLVDDATMMTMSATKIAELFFITIDTYSCNGTTAYHNATLRSAHPFTEFLRSSVRPFRDCGSQFGVLVPRYCARGKNLDAWAVKAKDVKDQQSHDRLRR